MKSYFSYAAPKFNLYGNYAKQKKFLILCGEEDAFRSGVNRTDDASRQTTLCHKLKDRFLPENEMMEEDEENLSPYDFM
ncbi:hypothetical protein GCM10020331_036110 [Ectobacillus funiculus]